MMRQALELVFYFEPILDRVAIPIYGGKVAEKADSIKAAADELRPELAAWRSAVAATPFLVGDAISAADCTAFPFIQQLLRASGKEAAAPLALGFLPFEGTYPALAAWIERIEALPGYERTYPPHWR